MLQRRLLVMRFFQSANVLGVILTLYYRAHGLNYVQILSFEIILSVAMVVFTVPLGLLADRHGRVRALKYGNVAFMAGAVLFLLARVYWQFLLSDFLYGIGLAWQSGADTALLAPGGARWFSRYKAVGAVSGLVSSVLAGFLLQSHGMHMLVILNTVAAMLAGLSILTLPDDAPDGSPVPPVPWRHLNQAYRAVHLAPWVVAWTVAAAVGFRLVGINLMFLDLPLWVARGWRGIWLGVGVAALYAAGWGSLLAPALEARLGTRAVLVASQLGMGVLVILLPFVGSPALLTVVMGMGLLLQSWQTPLTNARITAETPGPIQVTVLSMLDVPSLAVTVVGEIGVGLLADLHLGWALWASGGAILLALPLWLVRPRNSQKIGASVSGIAGG